VIRLLSAQDSSLSFRMTSKGGCHSERASLLFLSFWTRFWARKNPYRECEKGSCKIVASLIHDSSHQCARFFTIVQNDLQRGVLFWTSFLLFLSFWTRFWARKNPSIECVSRSSETVASLILDSSPECARFFTIVQNDKQRGMSFWTSFPSFFVILNSLLGEEESQHWVCE